MKDISSLERCNINKELKAKNFSSPDGLTSFSKPATSSLKLPLALNKSYNTSRNYQPLERVMKPMNNRFSFSQTQSSVSQSPSSAILSDQAPKVRHSDIDVGTSGGKWGSGSRRAVLRKSLPGFQSKFSALVEKTRMENTANDLIHQSSPDLTLSRGSDLFASQNSQFQDTFSTEGVRKFEEEAATPSFAQIGQNFAYYPSHSSPACKQGPSFKKSSPTSPVLNCRRKSAEESDSAKMENLTCEPSSESHPQAFSQKAKVATPPPNIINVEQSVIEFPFNISKLGRPSSQLQENRYLGESFSSLRQKDGKKTFHRPIVSLFKNSIVAHKSGLFDGGVRSDLCKNAQRDPFVSKSRCSQPYNPAFDLRCELLNRRSQSIEKQIDVIFYQKPRNEKRFASQPYKENTRTNTLIPVKAFQPDQPVIKQKRAAELSSEHYSNDIDSDALISFLKNMPKLSIVEQSLGSSIPCRANKGAQKISALKELRWRDEYIHSREVPTPFPYKGHSSSPWGTMPQIPKKYK